MAQPFEISYKDNAPIQKILTGAVSYAPLAQARAWRAKYNKPESVGIFHTLSVYAMGMGHIALAEALVQEGADPRQANVSAFHLHELFNNSYDYATADRAEGFSIPQLLARQYGKHVIAPDEADLRRTRVEVLRHVLANPTVWPADLAQVKCGATALVATLSAHNGYHYYAPVQSAADEDETIGFMQALIDHGASVNPECKHNLLEAAIPNFKDNQHPSFALLDKVIAWGVDTKKFAPHAWARAINQDVDRRYTKNASYGPRAKALMERGMGLTSPTTQIECFSPLAQAFLTNMRPALDQLIAQGADPCWVDPCSHATLLTLAAHRRGPLVALLNLFPVGAFKDVIHLTDDQGNTALHMAVNALDVKLVQRLLAEGADIQALNDKGQKPIQAMKRSGLAAQEKFDAVLDLLMSHGADLGADKRSSGLHQAAGLLSPKAISRLLANGEDPHRKDAQGKTPVSLVLLAHQQSVGSYFDAKRGARQVASLRAFTEAGVDINRALPDGSTMLHHAVERCSDLAVRELIEHGADIHATDKSGTLAMHAWNGGYYDSTRTFNDKNQAAIISVIEAFIAAGADMEQVDADGKLPFEKARELPGVKAALERAVLARATASTGEPTGHKRMRL